MWLCMCVHWRRLETVEMLERAVFSPGMIMSRWEVDIIQGCRSGEQKDKSMFCWTCCYRVDERTHFFSSAGQKDSKR